MADGSVTLGQLAPDALAKIGLDHNPATAEGSLLAVPHGQQPPRGYALYKRSDRDSTLVWEERAPLPEAQLTYKNVEVVNGNIYFVTNHNAYKYALEEDSWSTISLPSDFAVGSLVSYENELYVFNSNKIHIYNPKSESWRSLDLEIDIPNGAYSLTYNSMIYLVGGDANLLEFDPSNNTFNTLASMSQVRTAHKAVIFQNRIWAIGGNNGSVDSRTVESYDFSTNTWRAEPSLAQTRAWSSVWIAENKLFVAGTWNRSSIECFDPSLNTWSSYGNLPSIRGGADSVTLHKGEVFLLGGEIDAVNHIHTASVISALISPPMDLYYREANASGTITLDKLSTELASEFASSSAVSAPVGISHCGGL
jgi:hypothetical protein